MAAGAAQELGRGTARRAPPPDGGVLRPGSDPAEVDAACRGRHQLGLRPVGRAHVLGMVGGNGPSTPDGALGPSRPAPTILDELTLVRAGVGCSVPTLAGNVERQRIIGICETNRGT